LQSAIAQSSGKSKILVRSRSDYPEAITAGSTVVVTPDLIYGSYAKRFIAIAKLLSALTRCQRSIVIGADIMDGTYQETPSIARFQFAWLAGKATGDSRIVGFSWSPDATPSCRSAAKVVHASGVRLYARDPRSRDRLRAIGVDAVLTSDIVFGDRSYPKPTGLAAVADTASKPYVVLNISGLSHHAETLLEAYVAIANHLHSRGYVIYLLPHVRRDRDGDLAVAHRLHHRVGEGQSRLANLETPLEVASLAAGAALVVTGRMHLAVLSMMQGVPTVAIASHGKVEGLMELFGTGRLVVDPARVQNGALLDAAEYALSNRRQLSEQIRARLPEVTLLARRNFA